MAHRAVWERKPALRAVYHDIYRRILDVTVPGRTLEIGGGPGNFKAVAPATITSDIMFAPWLDLVCDAQRLPFASDCFANLVMIDVIHHVQNPFRFLNEAARVLADGGRLIFCEPAITPLSGMFYRLLHHEPVDMSVDPLRDGAISSDKDPYDSNQAIPTLLVGRFRDVLARAVPALKLRSVDWFSFLAYPLSGGFKSWCLLPSGVAGPLLAAERRLHRSLGRLAGFRLLAVYEKTALPRGVAKPDRR
jgi:SAM-dependent methyltransferase